MSRRVYVCCQECDFRVVEKYTGCPHQEAKSGFSRGAAPLAVVFRGPNGEIQVPGQATSRLPPRLQKLGYTVETIQDAQQYSQFCKEMDSEAAKKHEAAVEARDRYLGAKQAGEREALRRQMTTQFGRDFLEKAINEGEKRYGERYDAGSHLEGFEYDTKHGRD